MATASNLTLAEDARVLVIGMSALGDVVFALETVASLAKDRPNAKIDYLVEDRFAELLRGHSQIQRLWVFPRKRRWKIPFHLLRLLFHQRYDVVLDLHGNLKSGLHLLFCRSRIKLGFDQPIAQEGSWRFLSHRTSSPDPLPHRADRGLLLLQQLGLTGTRQDPKLPQRELAPIWEEEAGKRIVLHPGTSNYAAFKRWPTERFALLAQRLLRDGMQVAISCGPGEDGLAAKIQQAAEGCRLIPIQGGLQGLAWVIDQADLVVAADTGPLHIAAALGKPVVALFGPKDPRQFYPRVPRHVVLYHDVPCRPCRRRQCVSAQCVRGVDIDSVETAISNLLGEDA